MHLTKETVDISDWVEILKLKVRGVDSMGIKPTRENERCSVTIWIKKGDYTTERSLALSECLSTEENHPYITSDGVLHFPDALFSLLPPNNEVNGDLRCTMQLQYQYTRKNTRTPWERVKRKLFKWRKHIANTFRYSHG